MRQKGMFVLTRTTRTLYPSLSYYSYSPSAHFATSTTSSSSSPQSQSQPSKSSYGRKQIGYIPSKMKEEIIALHDENPKRWTATTLSSRFGAPRENVEGLLKLSKLRHRRQEILNKMDKEQRLKIEQLRDRAVNAWNSLSSVSPTLQTPNKSPSTTTTDNLPIEKEEENEETEQLEEFVEKSQWAQYIEQNYHTAETDAIRRTTFAFIEIGKKGEGHKGIQRAVWIRDGKTGKLRLPDREERQLLTNDVKVRDSKAFLSLIQ